MGMPVLKAFIPKPIAIKALVKVCENGQVSVRLEVDYFGRMILCPAAGAASSGKGGKFVAEKTQYHHKDNSTFVTHKTSLWEVE
jgi:hypothetical protein